MLHKSLPSPANEFAATESPNPAFESQIQSPATSQALVQFQLLRVADPEPWNAFMQSRTNLRWWALEYYARK